MDRKLELVESSGHSELATPDPSVGDTVVAEDGVVGEVETVLRGEDAEPRFFVVRARGPFRRRHPVVSVGLVDEIERADGVVHVRGSRAAIRRLPEALPLVF